MARLPYMILAVSCLAGAAGCADSLSPDSDLRVEPTQEEYGPGDTFELHVHNMSRHTIRIGVCPEALYPEGGGASVGFDTPCPAVLVTLRSGRTMVMSGSMPEGIAPGAYRAGVKYSFNEGSGTAEARSDAFGIVN